MQSAMMRPMAPVYQVPHQAPAPPAAAALPRAAWTPPSQPLSAPPRPKGFVPQKWRVLCSSMVRVGEHPESAEVRALREGEIVESVGPPLTLPNGVIRLEIAHPSSAAYPSPIGWVTFDDTAAGGSRMLEPGPQPLRPNPGGFKGGWRPRSSRPFRPPRPAGGSYTNMSWRPGAQ